MPSQMCTSKGVSGGQAGIKKTQTHTRTPRARHIWLQNKSCDAYLCEQAQAHPNTDTDTVLPSYALAALTRLDHSRPQAVSGNGISPGSSRRSGGTLSIISERDSSDADSGTKTHTNTFTHLTLTSLIIRRMDGEG